MFQFSFEPKLVSEEHYENAREEIIQYYSKNDDVISIYEYGSVSSPGVSDLDIILVLRDKIVSSEKIFDFANISEKVHRLVADGNVMKMSRENFTNINFLDNKINVKKLYGEELLVNTPEVSDQLLLDLISVIDWLPERILRLTKVITQKEINITMVLCILHSFSYSIRRVIDLAKLESSQNSSIVILDEISRLRNKWHSLSNPHEMLVNCIEESISIGYLYMDIFENYLKDSANYCDYNFDLDEEINLELYKDHYIKFSNYNEYSKKESLARNISNKNKTCVVISSYFYPHFRCLANQEGILSSEMNKKIIPNFKLESEVLSKNYKRNLVKKMSVAESNARFLVGNNMKSGLIRYGFHFKS